MLPTGLSRFEWIVRGDQHGPHEIFDQDLASFEYAAVLPTRGALVPAWLLIVPRQRLLSLAEMDDRARARIIAIADAISERVAAREGSAIVFEHGPGRRGSAASCGVEQAHLHVVGTTAPVFDRLLDAVPEVVWSRADLLDPWCKLPARSDYLMVRSKERAVVAQVAVPTSQRLRRAMASVLGLGDEWDYRSFPQESNALRTVRMFSGGFSDIRP